MGSSDSGGTGLADGGVGSIVWVRRRNGSWWPGKILGAAELATSHLMSPRSGTPVKLLGREDASVDWYNLEKSKRVKAFRCGEFDDCIERAEASLGLPAKKREKYARREDAILHALELEKELLEKYGKMGTSFSSTRNNASGSAAKDLVTSSGALENGNDRNESIELQQLPKRCALPTDEYNPDILPVHKGKSGNSETNARTRGSQDSGVRTALPKKMVSSSSVALNGSRKAMSDDQAQTLSGGGICLESSRGVDSGNSPDRGNGLVDESVEEFSMKRHDRHRPLVQVMQTSTKQRGCSLQPDVDILSASGQNHAGVDARVKRHRSLYLPSESTDLVDIYPHSLMEIAASHLGVVDYSSHPDAFVGNAFTGSLEDSELDSFETDSKKHNMDVELPKISAVNKPMKVQALVGLEMRVDHQSTSSDGSYESLPDDTSQIHQHNPMSLDTGVSRWKLKGKRNVRSLMRRSDKFSQPRSLIQRPSHNLRFYQDHDYINDIDFIEDDLEPHTEGYDSRGYMSKASSKRRNSGGSDKNDFEELTWRRNGGLSLIYGGHRGREMLFDVDLKVQADHQREHVPWVSLMSRLNRKPILGHPVQIETLGDGSTDALLSSTDPSVNYECEADRNRAPPVWTTARGTANFRVPRSGLSSQLDEADNQHLDQDQKLQSQKSVSRSSSAKKKNLPRRKPLHVPKPPKKSSSFSMKIRHLSSIGIGSGVTKPLDSGGPTVSCIPVKLVFSRLVEAVGRSPSQLTNHRGFDEQQ